MPAQSATATGRTAQVFVDARELFKLIETLPRNLHRKYAREALRSGAKVVQAAVKQTVPKRTGALQQAIKVRSARRRDKSAVGVNVVMGKGFFKGPTFYGAFVEFGHKAGRRGLPNRREIPAKRFMTHAGQTSGPGALHHAAGIIRARLEAIRKGDAK